MSSNKLIQRTSCVLILSIGISACGDSDGKVDYAALGASDVLGVGAEPPSKGYVFQIEDGLDNEPSCDGADLKALGIPGGEAEDIEDTTTNVAVELDPDLATLFTGANDLVDGDTVEEFEGHLNDILSDLDGTKAQVFVANLPKMQLLPTFLESPDPDVTAARVDAFNAAIARQVAAHGDLLVDLFNELPPDDALVSDDGFHPSNEGHQAIADLLAQILPRVCAPGQTG